MDTGILCSKEMVDLLMRIKRHAKTHQGVTINMSDRDVMNTLMELAPVKDDLLQGMVQYFMVLAGGDWKKRYDRASGLSSRTDAIAAFASKVKDSLLKDVNLSSDIVAPVAESSATVRYYRGQPVYS